VINSHGSFFQYKKHLGSNSLQERTRSLCSIPFRSNALNEKLQKRKEKGPLVIDSHESSFHSHKASFLSWPSVARIILSLSLGSSISKAGSAKKMTKFFGFFHRVIKCSQHSMLYISSLCLLKLSSSSLSCSLGLGLLSHFHHSPFANKQKK